MGRMFRPNDLITIVDSEKGAYLINSEGFIMEPWQVDKLCKKLKRFTKKYSDVIESNNDRLESEYLWRKMQNEKNNR